MTFKLSKEALDSLPAPDSQGVIRVTAAIKVSPEGEADLLEINDAPVGSEEESDDQSESSEPTPDDEAPMPEGTEPDLMVAQRSIDKAAY